MPTAKRQRTTVGGRGRRTASAAAAGSGPATAADGRKSKGKAGKPPADHVGGRVQAKLFFKDAPVPDGGADPRSPSAAGAVGLFTPVRPKPPSTETCYTMSGVEIRFPFPAYGSQVAMMSKITKALQRSENALLESPTGSGKSLALLCACLAWREAEKKALAAAWIEQKQAARDEAALARAVEASIAESLERTGACVWDGGVPASEPVQRSPPGRAQNEAQAAAADADDDDDFQPARPTARPLPPAWPRREPAKRPAHDGPRNQRPSTAPVLASVENIPPRSLPVPCASPDMNSVGAPKAPVNPASKPEQPKKFSRFPVPPKIFFGSRTHKQLTQLINELKSNTAYRPKMAVLGSRNQYCIHPTVSKSKNRNEECAQLLDSEGCAYFNGVRQLRASREIARGGKHEVWDIEDLAKLGRSHKACPYFAARALAEEADVVFLPYNYICDPVIRDAMEVKVDGAVVVLDEAHNIEDVARAAGSYEVTEIDLQHVAHEMEDLIGKGILVSDIRPLLHIVESLLGWIMDENNTYSTTEYERKVNIWSGPDIISKLSWMGIRAEVFGDFCKNLNEVRATKEKESEDQDGPGYSMSARSIQVVSSLLMVLGYLFDKSHDYAQDYRMALIKRVHRQFGWRGRAAVGGAGKQESEWTYKLGFWCLNPGVTFSPLSEKAKCVILTSGTLSPMDSFASELQTTFPIRLEANHVIDQSQVWVGTVPSGPAAIEFSGTYAKTESLDYQDDLGAAILELVRSMPGGALCFLPSYSLMDKLMARWQSTGLYDRLNAVKLVLTEPKSAAGREAFESTINAFYRQIDDPGGAFRLFGKKGKGKKDQALVGHLIASQEGALLFAVFRGKISEGIDFSDDYARLVMAVGIPYPNVKDIVMKLKREYNDMRFSRARAAANPVPRGFDRSGQAKSLAMLSGNQWYEIQAFRAINQALGRCIRHRNDWGAIVLLDHRFLHPKNISGLSKWVRPLFRKFDRGSFASAKDSIGEFSRRMMAAGGEDTKPKGAGCDGTAKPVDAMNTPSVKRVAVYADTPATAFSRPAGRPDATGNAEGGGDDSDQGALSEVSTLDEEAWPPTQRVGSTVADDDGDGDDSDPPAENQSPADNLESTGPHALVSPPNRTEFPDWSKCSPSVSRPPITPRPEASVIAATATTFSPVPVDTRPAPTMGQGPPPMPPQLSLLGERLFPTGATSASVNRAAAAAAGAFAQVPVGTCPAPTTDPRPPPMPRPSLQGKPLFPATGNSALFATCCHCKAPLPGTVAELVPAADVKEHYPRSAVSQILASASLPAQPVVPSPPRLSPRERVIAVVRRPARGQSHAGEGSPGGPASTREAVFCSVDGLCYEDFRCPVCKEIIGVRALAAAESSGAEAVGNAWIVVDRNRSNPR